MKKIAVIFGTKLDAIKLAPIVVELKKFNKQFQVICISAIQNQQLSDQVLPAFNIHPNYDLNILQPNHSLSEVTKNIIEALDEIFLKEKPDLVLIHGNTATSFIGSLAALYMQIPVGHVGAGVRTNNKFIPFPEEISGRLSSVISELHFTQTDTAKKALLKENISPHSVFTTGSTITDASELVAKDNYVFKVTAVKDILAQKKKIILLAMYNRDNWGEPIKEVCNAVKKLSQIYSNYNFVLPVHLNPVVKEIVHNTLEDLQNVHLVAPLDYPDFVNLMSESYLVVTDSLAVYEEGSRFGIPILVLKKIAEQTAAVKSEIAKSIGLDESKIFLAVRKLLNSKNSYKKAASSVTPCGDGLAAKRIVQVIQNYFGLSKQRIKEFIPKK